MFRKSVNIVSICIISMVLQCDSLTQLTATTTPGFFFSPIFPEHTIQQSWRLKAADPGHVIHLEVVDSEIDASIACLYDYLQVYDGPGTSDGVIGKVCTEDEPSYVTTTGSMFVLFTPDPSGRYLGFYMKFYSSVPATGNQPPVEVPVTTIQPRTSVEPVTETNPIGQSNAAASTLSATSLIGILIAVAFCLTVIVVIIASICIHNSNKIDVQPKRKPDEEEIWRRVSALPKPRKQIPSQTEANCSNSSTSTFYLNTSSTSGVSSGAPCSPSSLYPVITEGEGDPEDHQYHTLSPVPEVVKSVNSVDDDERPKTSSPRQYAHADMMELSPRRLLPIRVAPVKTTTLIIPKGGQLPDSASFYDEINGKDATSTPRSQTSDQGLPNSLQRARQARRVRFKESKKSGEDFERGHTHMKNSLINRIDLVRCGVLTGQRSGVPRVEEASLHRERVQYDS